MKQCLIIACLSIIISACLGPEGSPEGSRAVPIEMLKGKWADLSKKRHFLEEWQLKSPDHLVGKGFVMDASDTVFIEQLEIKPVKGVLTYLAKVSGQNSNETIGFSLVENKDDRVVFENLSHDFPQKIIYHFQTRSTMHVYLEGFENGTFRKSKLVFEKQVE